MRQFILPEDFKGQSSLSLTGETFHYLCRVIRKKEGDSFPGLDKEGNRWKVTITSITDDHCLIDLEKDEINRSHNAELTLVQCLPKGKKMDLVIRQAVEAGIKEIIPVLSDHAVPRFENDKDLEKKRLRWEKIAIEAMQQSGSSILPVIHKAVKMDDLPSLWNNRGPGLYCHQKRIDDNSLHLYLNGTPSNVCIVIGPEGGLSDRELSLLDTAGFRPVYLGDNVLRTETAALFATAAVKVILLENNVWSLRNEQ